MIIRLDAVMVAAVHWDRRLVQAGREASQEAVEAGVLELPTQAQAVLMAVRAQLEPSGYGRIR